MPIKSIVPFSRVMRSCYDLQEGGGGDVAHGAVGEEQVLEVRHVGQEAGSHGHGGALLAQELHAGRVVGVVVAWWGEIKLEIIST